MNIIKLNNLVEESQKEKSEAVYYVRELPDPLKLKDRTILGSMSISQKGGRVRYIKKSKAIKLSNGLIETAPKIARLYLKDKFGRSPRIKPALVDKLVNGLRTMPFYNKPCDFEMGFYIDIKSAYWSIINAVGWDVDYNPNKWLSRATVLDDFPLIENKIARSCLVSVTAIEPKSKKAVLTVADPEWKKNGMSGFIDNYGVINTLANPALQKIVSDVLNAIASQAKEAGAIYIHTDGYIAPNEYIAGHIIDIIQNWGLEARVKAEGKGGVVSHGVYKVGNEQSKNYIEFLSKNHHDHIYKPPYIKWLEKSFSFWASGANITP